MDALRVTQAQFDGYSMVTRHFLAKLLAAAFKGNISGFKALTRELMDDYDRIDYAGVPGRDPDMVRHNALFEFEAIEGLVSRILAEPDMQPSGERPRKRHWRRVAQRR